MCTFTITPCLPYQCGKDKKRPSKNSFIGTWVQSEVCDSDLTTHSINPMVMVTSSGIHTGATIPGFFHAEAFGNFFIPVSSLNWDDMNLRLCINISPATWKSLHRVGENETNKDRCEIIRNIYSSFLNGVVPLLMLQPVP